MSALPPTHPDWTPTGYVRCGSCKTILYPHAVHDGLCYLCVGDIQKEAEAILRTGETP